MRILYFGTICKMEHYEAVLSKCKSKPTVATVVFETALMEGLYKNGADVEIHSFPMVPTFPDSRLLYFGGKSENLECGYRCRWLRTINLPILKQWTRRLDARKVIKQWAQNRAEESVIVTYSIPPFLVKTILKLAKLYRIKTVAIIPDLPNNMYINHRSNPVINAIKDMYLNASLRYQGYYDGYIYLTEGMRDVVAPNKPYIVMEGILNDKNEVSQRVNGQINPKVIMYAGRLHEKYGVMNLLDAFDQLKELDAELWLFGDGTAVEEIKERAKKNQKVRYFGRVSHKDILKYEKEATLLVNPRSKKDEFTKYSFPSKIIEYMFSGTPLLTTELEGIPKEYYEYIFTIRDNDSASLAKMIKHIFSLPEESLKEKGKKAQDFVRNSKNSIVQSGRIMNFLTEIIGDMK